MQQLLLLCSICFEKLRIVLLNNYCAVSEDFFALSTLSALSFPDFLSFIVLSFEALSAFTILSAFNLPCFGESDVLSDFTYLSTAFVWMSSSFLSFGRAYLSSYLRISSSNSGVSAFFSLSRYSWVSKPSSLTWSMSTAMLEQWSAIRS